MVNSSSSHCSSNRSAPWTFCAAKNLVGAVLLATLLSSCSAILLLKPSSRLSSANLDFKVAPSSSPGTYSISGNTDLPEGSQVRVAALRYLHADSQASRDLNPKPTYAILAYQTAEVQQGKWQANLNLWKVAQDGKFQETWQLEQPQLKMTFKPDSEVVFVATNAIESRADLVQRLDQQLKKQGKTLENGLVLTLPENQRYIRASQLLAIALPTGSTTPPGIRPEDINGGWGNRFLMPEESQNPIKLEMPENRRTNALPSPQEFLR